MNNKYHFNQKSTLSWIFSHVFLYKHYLAAFVFSVLLAHFLSTLIPIYTGRAFSEIKKNDPQLIVIGKIALTAFAIYAFKFFADVTSIFSIEIIAQRVKRDARDELYINLLQKKQSFHNRQRVGDIMARAINDARLVDYMLSPGISFAFSAFTALIMPILFIGFFKVELLLAPIMFLILFWITVQHYIKKLYPVSADMRRCFGNLNARLTESISGIEVIKWSAQEHVERENFSANTQDYRNLFVKRGIIQALYLPTLCLGIAMAVGAVHSLFLMSQSQMTIGEVVMYLGWLGLLYFPTTISESSITVIQEGYAGAVRMLDLIKEEIETLEICTEEPRKMEGKIEFKQVTFSYDKKPILKDISFTAEPGETVAIVGPTGSGKTTLTKLLNRTYDADFGKILIDGIDIDRWSLQSLRSQTGNVEQDVFLFSKSIADNIAFGAENGVDQATVEEAAKKAGAHSFITSFEDKYQTTISEKGVSLSGGQRQRLVIARALLSNPKILILDDSTSAVDSATEEEIRLAIQSVMKKRTTLLISHRLSQIRMADKILVLDNGRIIAQGNHEELIRSCKLYSRIYLRGRKTEEQVSNECNKTKRVDIATEID